MVGGEQIGGNGVTWEVTVVTCTENKNKQKENQSQTETEQQKGTRGTGRAVGAESGQEREWSLAGGAGLYGPVGYRQYEPRMLGAGVCVRVCLAW